MIVIDVRTFIVLKYIKTYIKIFNLYGVYVFYTFYIVLYAKVIFYKNFSQKNFKLFL